VAMKKPIIGYEYADLITRDNRISELQDKRRSRRERYLLRHLNLHQAGGREGLAEKWYALNDNSVPPPPIKKVVALLEHYAYRNGCSLMMELCEECLKPRDLRDDDHHSHYCDYDHYWSDSDFAEELGEGQFLVRSCYSDDWESYHIYRFTSEAYPDQNFDREDSVGYLHLVKSDEMTQLENDDYRKRGDDE
jgi:hypothetical protein